MQKRLFNINLQKLSLVKNYYLLKIKRLSPKSNLVSSKKKKRKTYVFTQKKT